MIHNRASDNWIWYPNQQMHIVSVWKYVIHTVYLLHVSATHVTIFKEVHYNGQIQRNITYVFEPVHIYKILN